MSDHETDAALAAGVASAANLQAVQTASAQGERLAVVETQIKDIKADVAEIKVDVKTLLASQAAFEGGTNLLGRAVPWVALAVSVGSVVSVAL